MVFYSKDYCIVIMFLCPPIQAALIKAPMLFIFLRSYI